MLLRFTKMHGIGNDFVVIDAISQKVRLSAEKIRKLADRRFGIGCDQVLIVEAPTQPDCDFLYRIYNADGSEVENCGNGARCFARFVHDRKLTGKKSIVVETAQGQMTLNLEGSNEVRVDMGSPILAPDDIPFKAPQQQLTYPLFAEGEEHQISAVSMGNPHAVLIVDDVATAPVEQLGKTIESHDDFPNRVNVGFMEIVDRSEINLRVFERGVGETLACGTGACAAVVAGVLRGLLDSAVKVNLPGGSLSIQWQGDGEPVLMTGPAQKTFHGQVRI